MFEYFGKLPLQPVETIVDLGAAEGNWLAAAIQWYKPSRWMAVEMLPDQYGKLKGRFSHQLNAGIGEIHHCAVGEKQGMEQILRTVSPDSSSLLHINPKAQDWYTTAPGGMAQSLAGNIPVLTLDTLCVDFPAIDLMKIDVQGYERRVIDGGGAALKKTKAVIIEVLFCEHYFGQSTAEEIRLGLNECGLYLDCWLETNYSRDGHTLLQGDALYLRK